MRAFSYAWSLPVTWRRWRSRHAIHHSRKPHAARKLYGSMRHWKLETKLLPIKKNLHCGNKDFRPLAPVTLKFNPMNFIYHTNLTRRPIPWRYRPRPNGWATINFLRQGFLVLSSDRHTNNYKQTIIYRETHTLEFIYHAVSRVVKHERITLSRQEETGLFILFIHRDRTFRIIHQVTLAIENNKRNRHVRCALCSPSEIWLIDWARLNVPPNTL